MVSPHHLLGLIYLLIRISGKGTVVPPSGSMMLIVICFV